MMRPEEVAGYYLYRSADDGDLITNLKMQKLVYYAYVWNLVINNERLFDESIEAWPNGPVIPDLYRSLSQYRAGPIPLDYTWLADAETVDTWRESIPADTLRVLDQVYDEYAPLSAFELISRTHNERPWQHAREGLAPTERCYTALQDGDIRDEYAPRLSA